MGIHGMAAVNSIGSGVDYAGQRTQRAAFDPVRFRRRCAIIGLVFLLVSQFGKLIWFDHTNRTQLLDFNQYYMGGMMARDGAWDSLYPVPVANSKVNVG